MTAQARRACNAARVLRRAPGDVGGACDGCFGLAVDLRGPGRRRGTLRPSRL